jgi:hypothetical protein
MPIDKHVNGTDAELTLRRAATNGETTVVVVGTSTTGRHAPTR